VLSAKSIAPDTEQMQATGGLQLNALLFDGGSKAGMAAFLCLVSVSVVAQSYKETGPGAMRDPKVVDLLKSVMSINSIYKADQAAQSSHLDSTISRIVKQNIDSKATAVSSWDWANLLQSLVGDDHEKVTMADAVDLYNQHPQIRGYQDSNSKGAGSLDLDRKKVTGIKNWFDKTDPTALAIVIEDGHDFPFHLGSFGEPFAHQCQYFLESECLVKPDPNCELQPLENEEHVAIDWRLRLEVNHAVCGYDVQPQRWIFNRAPKLSWRFPRPLNASNVFCNEIISASWLRPCKTLSLLTWQNKVL
jgi:hypothetical protein